MGGLVAGDLDPATIAATLLSHLTGAEPRPDLIDILGGWDAVEVLAPTLVNQPLLRPTLRLLARGIAKAHAGGTSAENDAGAMIDALRPAACALSDAVTATTDPGLFEDTMSSICSDADLADVVGDQVAAACVALASPPRSGTTTPTEAEVVRHAVALESAARLALLGHGTRHEILATLVKVNEPQPLRYARAVARTVEVAYHHWNAADGIDDVADVLDVLTGVTSATRADPATNEEAGVLAAADDQLRREIAGDAAWAKANTDVARAVRAESVTELVAHLDEALASLTFVITQGDRPDAVLLQSALGLLRNLLSSLSTDAGPQDAEAWAMTLHSVGAVAARARQLLVDTHGLSHWSGDRKVTVLHAWDRFVADLGYLREQLGRDSIYDAATVIDDILTIYTTSSAFDVIAPGRGVDNVVRIIRPAISKGFAARSGLLRNLVDHTESLRGRVAALEARTELGDSGVEDDVDAADRLAQELADLSDQLATAETVLAAAKTSAEAAVAETPGKAREQERHVPPLLAEIVGLAANTSLDALDQAKLDQLAAALADRKASTLLEPDLVVTAVRREMLEKLAASADFTGDVADAVTMLLDQLIRFVATRQGAQPSWCEYLFKPDADEADLHKDLYDWLMGGELSSATNVEVQQIGGGRVDLMVTFPGFHLYIELKETATQTPVEGKVAYIKQAVTYGAADVRIGFLVVLRSKAPKATSPHPNLRDLVTHAAFEVTPGAPESHIVMLEVPGDRTAPSQMKK
jgi:hypothetical protein